jgi:hypothetical protein
MELIPYILFFSVAGIPALTTGPRRSREGWLLAWLVFVLFIGLRHQVGTDWPNYIGVTSRLVSTGFEPHLWEHEILFSFVNWTSAQLGFGIYGTNLIGALIFCAGLFSFCSRQPYRWLALAAAVPFLVVAGAMSANRQAMAIGVVLYVMARWKELSIGKQSVGIGIAGLFHSSAYALLILTIIGSRMNNFLKTVLSIGVAIGAYYLMSRSDIGSEYAQEYILYRTGHSPGAAAHLLLNLAPALFLLATRKWWAKALPNWPLIRSLCIAAIIIAFLVPFFSQAASRMSLYLFPISISFFAWLPRMVSNANGRVLVKLASVVSLAAVLLVWIVFSNQSYAYRPYQNLLTVDFEDLDLPR